MVAVTTMAPWRSGLGPRASEAGPLRSAAEAGLAERFHGWRGRSGRRYVVSVYAADQAPDYADAVVLHVARSGHGRRIVSVGIGPRGVAPAGVDEVHVHLLARDDMERAAVVDDLRQPLERGPASPR
jgi:hypothetical protein